MRALLVAGCASLVIVGCKSRTPVPDAAPPLTVAMHGPADTEGSLVVPAVGAVDLWQEMAGVGAARLMARGEKGSYVHGDVANNADQRLVLRREGDKAVVELLRGPPPGSVVARAVGVTTIELDEGGPPPPPPPDLRPALTITVAGRPPMKMAPDALEEVETERQRRRGAPLANVLEAAGVTGDVKFVLVQSGPLEYRVEGAWLRSEADALLLGYNHQGALRFTHERDGKELHKLKGVTALTVETN